MNPKNVVRVSIVMDMDVSDDYLEKLQDNLRLEVLKHCFKNHTRHLINESMEVIKNEFSNQSI
jgi:hypothetical protein